MSDLSKSDWVRRFADFALYKKSLYDWNIKFLDFEDGSSCNNELKKIEISGLGKESWYYLKEIILHEIAHALASDNNTGKTSATSHDADFFKRYGKLLIEFSDNEPLKESRDE